MRCHAVAALFLIASWLPLAVSVPALVRKEKSHYVIDARGQSQFPTKVEGRLFREGAKLPPETLKN